MHIIEIGGMGIYVRIVIMMIAFLKETNRAPLSLTGLMNYLNELMFTT